MSKILVVDEDPAVRTEMLSYFGSRGFEVFSASSGRDGLARFYADRPDAVLMENCFSDVDGLTVCRTLRNAEGASVPVLFVAKNAELPERIAAFESGADDFVQKPTAVEEIFARVQALLRRTKGTRVDVLTAGDLTMDRVRHRVMRGSEEIPLTLTEYKLLEYLVRNKNQALTRKQILDAVWGGNADGFTNIVDVYINYLRRKLERPEEKKIIKTVRGIGYLLEE